MSNLLNKNHPFRATITHSATSSPASEPAPAPAKPAEYDDESGAKLTRRLRVIAGCAAGGVIFYISAIVVPSLFDFTEDSKDTPRSSGKPSNGISQEVEEDWAYQGQNRSVDEARESAGIFGRLFCRGGRRSTFCD